MRKDSENAQIIFSNARTNIQQTVMTTVLSTTDMLLKCYQYKLSVGLSKWSVTMLMSQLLASWPANIVLLLPVCSWRSCTLTYFYVATPPKCSFLFPFKSHFQLFKFLEYNSKSCAILWGDFSHYPLKVWLIRGQRGT